MAAESKLQTRVRKDLTKKGWLVVKINLCSKPGWPDLEAIRFGRTVRLEMKSAGKPLEPLQEVRHEEIIYHGGEVYKIDSFEQYKTLNL